MNFFFFIEFKEESLTWGQGGRLALRVFGFCSFPISDECERMGVLYTGTGISLGDHLYVNIKSVSDCTRLKDTPNTTNP